jgi:hypothetical protein
VISKLWVVDCWDDDDDDDDDYSKSENGQKWQTKRNDE